MIFTPGIVRIADVTTSSASLGELTQHLTPKARVSAEAAIDVTASKRATWPARRSSGVSCPKVKVDSARSQNGETQSSSLRAEALG